MFFEFFAAFFFFYNFSTVSFANEITIKQNNGIAPKQWFDYTLHRTSRSIKVRNGQLCTNGKCSMHSGSSSTFQAKDRKYIGKILRGRGRDKRKFAGCYAYML